VQKLAVIFPVLLVWIWIGSGSTHEILSPFPSAAPDGFFATGQSRPDPGTPTALRGIPPAGDACCIDNARQLAGGELITSRRAVHPADRNSRVLPPGLREISSLESLAGQVAPRNQAEVSPNCPRAP